jgi:dihydropteroate synthase
MGVLNLSPESKNAPTVATDSEAAMRIADDHRRNGASVIDVGAQSSHFDNAELSPEEELNRLGDAVRRLLDEGFVVSIDTWKPAVVAGMIELGVSIINDTGGLRNPAVVDAIASAGVAAVVMYLEGETPLAVGSIELEGSLVGQMVDRLGDRVRNLADQGITDVAVDPGIGISYQGDRSAYNRHQIDVIRRLGDFRTLGKPVLLPVPRKTELAPTLALATLALEYGADILRVHDVEAVAGIARMIGRM